MNADGRCVAAAGERASTPGEVGKAGEKRRHRLLLLLVLSLALWTRFYDLSGNPNGFFCDEASYAYNGYSVMKTGRDEYGKPFPFYFKAFGEYKDPFPIYVTIPFLKLFGLTVFGTRFPVALFGFLSVLFGYLCARELATPRIALIVALFLALSPYHVHFSRIGFPTPYLHFFFLCGFYLLLRGLGGCRGALVGSAVPLGLTLYTYGVAKVFLPLFLLVFLVLFRRELRGMRRSLLVMGALLFLIALPVLHEALFGVGQDSFGWKSVFAPHTLTRREFEARLGKMPLLSGALGHPDLVSWLFFLDNYLWLLRPSTLFLHGDPLFRHNPTRTGFFSVTDLLLLLPGLYLLFTRRGGAIDPRRRGLLVLLWFAVAPVANSLLCENTGTRLLNLLPSLQIASAFAIDALIERVGRRRHLAAAALLFVALFFAVEHGAALYRYFVTAPRETGPYFQYGLREAIELVAKRASSVDHVYFSPNINQPYMLALFFLRYDPAKYQEERRVLNFETRPLEAVYSPSKRAIYVGKRNDLVHLLPNYVIRRPDGSVAYRIAIRNPRPSDARPGG